MSDYYLDGDFSSRTQAGPLIISRDPETRARLCKRTVYIDKEAFVPLKQPNAGLSGLVTMDVVIDGESVTMYFYEESQPRDTGSGIIELDEFYAEIPATYIESGLRSQSFQWLNGISNNIDERTFTVKCTIVNSFGLRGYDGVTDGSAAMEAHKELKYAFVYTALSNGTTDAEGNYLVRSGDMTYHSPNSTTDYLAADSDISRWKGVIHRRKEIFVDRPPMDLVKSIAITSPLSVTAVHGQSFTYQITCTELPYYCTAHTTDSGVDYIMNMTSGILTATFSSSGTYTFTITAHGYNATPATATLTVTVS